MATVSKEIIIKGIKKYSRCKARQEKTGEGGGGGKLLSTSAEEESANLLNNIGVVDCGIRLFSSSVYFPG